MIADIIESMRFPVPSYSRGRWRRLSLLPALALFAGCLGHGPGGNAAPAPKSGPNSDVLNFVLRPPAPAK